MLGKATMTTQKPHEAEEDYFAKLEVEKKRKLAEKKHADLQTHEIEAMKEAHQMRCSGCGYQLEPFVFKGLSINKCFHCGGAFLSEEAFRRLCGEDNQFLNLIGEIFQFKK
ncbi:MAG: zf-TFIIB domain-containing protein [Deltaproteobacteria bacterium]|nr:zf-TFIIB domain-containing protein [Deltaproteobacteria bacterium]